MELRSKSPLAVALSLVLGLGSSFAFGKARVATRSAATPITTVSLQTTNRLGALAAWQMDLVGLQMLLPAGKLQLPSGAAFSAVPRFTFGGKDATVAEIDKLIPTDAKLTGTFTSPGSGSVQLEGTPSAGLLTPALTQQGIYLVSDVKVVQGTRVLLEASPTTLSIECLGEVLISSVTATPMTMQEIKDAGIQLGAGNYEGRRFTMALTIGSRQVDLSVPVAIPIYNGVEDPRSGGIVSRLEIGTLEGGASEFDLNIVMADLKPDVDPFNLSRPGISHMLNHNFKALIVIPGSIGYLHQFYKVNLVVFNTLSVDSPFLVTHLKATYNPPPAADGVGALRLASRSGEGIDANAIKPIKAADEDGKPGEGPDQLRGGESGTATYYLEAMKTGSHPLNFLIQGQFEGGGLVEPVPLTGKAEGRVLVVNPTFNLMLVHPDIVRKGETYFLEARLTNTSQTLANGISLSIDRTRLGNVKLVETPEYPATQRAPGTLTPGQTVSFKFQFRAMKTGEVNGSYLYMEEGTIGYQLSMGVTERNVRLNPDTLALPQTLDGIPEDLREAMLKVLGQAYCVATSKNGLPAGVLPINRNVVTGQMAQALSEQGLFLKMGMERLRVWWDLWKLFTQNPDAGLDQLVRTTEAGAALRRAFLDAWSSWVDGQAGPAERVKDLATFGEGDRRHVLLGIQGAAPGLVIRLANASGQILQNEGVIPALGVQGSAWGSNASGFQLTQIPMSNLDIVQAVLTNNGSGGMELSLGVVNPVAGQGSPGYNAFSFTLGQGVSATLTLGPTRLLTARLTSRAGDLLGLVSASQSGDAPAEPFKVLSVHRYDIDLFPDATPYGTHVMMLFNRATMPLNLSSDGAGFQEAQALVHVEANQFWRKVTGYKTGDSGDLLLDQEGKPIKIPSPPALLKAYPRVVSLYLEKPVGPYITRQLTLADTWKDAAGNALQDQKVWTIQSGMVPGGAIVKGKVRKLDGTGIPAKLTYWYYSAVMEGSQQDLETSQLFVTEGVDSFYSLVTNNIDTASDGSYQFDFVPEPVSFALGPFLLQADLAEGKAFAQASVIGNGQTIQMDLVLEGKGSVTGYVLDAIGNPVADARVQAIQEQPTYSLTGGTGGGSFSVSGVTDANGFYRLDGLKTGVFSMRALKGLFGVAASNEIARDGQVVRQDLVLKGKTGRVRVQLLDDKGNPLFDQFVRLGFPAGLNRDGSGSISYVYPEEAKADSDGWIRFKDVPAGDIRLYAPYVPQNLVTDFAGYLEPEDELVTVLHILAPQEIAHAQILVKDASGNPISGAYVSWSGTRHAQFFAQTNEYGLTPQVGLRPGVPVTVYAYHPTWVGMIQGDSLTPQPKGEYVLTVDMPARATLQGTVRRPDGVPVQGAYVAIPPVYDDNNKNRLAITNAQGAYHLPDLPVDMAFRLAAVGPELLTSHNAQVQVGADQQLTLDITLPFVGSNTIQGTAYQPQEGAQKISTIAQVLAYGQLPSITPASEGNENWGLLFSTETGAIQSLPVTAEDVNDGRLGFKLTGLPAGPFTLSAANGLFPVVAEVKGDFGASHNATLTQDITLISTFAGELKGRVVMPDGQTPVAKGARVSITGGTIGDLTVYVQDNGIYKFAKVIPAGCYVLRAEDPATGYFFATNLKMVKEESQVRNLRLWGKGTLKVHAVDSQGDPLSLGDVTLTHSKNTGSGCGGALLEPNDLPDLVQSLQGATAGLLVFEDLLEGPISIKLRNQTGLIGMASVEMPVGGGDVEVTVKLQPVGGIRGMLLRSDGSPIPAGRVDAYGTRDGHPDAWLGVSPTCQEGVPGEFLFFPLPAGTVRLEAWDPDSRQVGSATLQVLECAETGPYTPITITCLDKGPVTIQVVDEHQQPVLRAGLAVVYQGGPALRFTTEATTDQDGYATFTLPPGSYQVTATDPVTLTTGSLAFTRNANQDAIAKTLVLKGVRSLFATVLPPPGAPGMVLAGWKLRAERFERCATMDQNGQGTLEDLPIGAYVLVLTDLEGRLRGRTAVNITQDGNVIQTAEMVALAYGTVMARLKDPEGHPVMGADLSMSGGLWSGFTPRTDAEGSATFGQVRQGTGTLYAAGASSSPFSITTEGQTVVVDLVTAPTAGIHGLVTDPLGNPVPYIAVTVRGQAGATDAQGRFHFEELPLELSMKVQATTGTGRAGWSASFTLTENHQDLEVNVTLQAIGSVQGRLTDPLRPQLPPMAIVISGGSDTIVTSSIDASGAFEVGSLPAGETLRLKVLWDDGSTIALDQTFTIPGEGETVTMDRQLPPFVGVKGWTKNSSGEKIPMTVILRNEQGQELKRAVTTGDLFDPDHPTFFFRYLTAGQTYRLDGCREMTTMVIATLSLTPAGDQEVQEVELRQPLPRTVHMALVYPDGSAAAGPGRFNLTATGILSGQWQGDLAVDGTATVADLPNGPFRLQVSAVANQPTLETTFDLTSLPGQTQEVQIPAVGLGSVNLTVKTASGRVLNGSAVSASGAGTPVWNAQPQGDGSWLLTSVWIGRPLTVEATGFGLLGARPSVSLDHHAQRLAVAYPAPDQGALAGTVKDTQGDVVPDARVELVGRNLVTTTDGSGAFRFEPLAVGNYTLLVTLPGHPNRALVNTTLSTDTEVRIQDLALKGTGTVHVTILKGDGSPYSAQAVSLRNTSPWSDGQGSTVASDASGLASFTDALEGGIQVSATLDGKLRTATGNLAEGGTLSLELRSRDTSRISGRVRRAIDANTWPAGTVATILGFSYGLQADGTLVPPTPEPWLDYTTASVPVQVNLASGASFSVGSISLVKNDVTSVDLRAPAFGSVQGVIRDSKNALVTGAVVSAGSLSTTTDAQGVYRLDGLTMGGTTLTASLPGHPNRAVDSANLGGDGGTFTLNMKLKGTGSVTVKTLATDGSNLGGQVVTLQNYSSWSSGQSSTATSDAQGLATFPDFLEGAITASATLEGLSCVSSGTLAADQTLALSLKPKPYSTISGRVQRANPALAWPQGTRLLVSSQYYSLANDGTIQVPSPNPHLDCGYYGTTSAYVFLPGGRQLSLGTVTFVKNNDTVLALTAPAFGSLSGTVKNSGGNPVSGVSIQIDGSSAGTTDAAGAWTKAEIPTGSHHVTASTATSIAMGDITLTDDGGSASLNFTLLSNSVALSAYMNFGRITTGAYVYADGRFYIDGGYNGTRPLIKVDGGAEAAPTAPSGIAQWLDKDHQLIYTTTMGPIEVTLTRTIAPQTCVARDEIRFRNTDTAAHSVSLRHAVYLDTYQGLPSNQSQPVLTGDNRDLGVLGYYGTILWGNGSDTPVSIDSNGFQWPEWTMAPGEQKTLALAHAPYSHASRNGDLRPGGASRVLDRVLHGAPEWIYGGEPSTWSNWLPTQVPAADPLPVWNASATLTVKDFLGRVPINQGNFSLSFESAEALAPRRSFTSGAVMTGLPIGGGIAKITVPGHWPGLALTRTLDATQNADLVLTEAAPVTVTVQDAHGALVSNASVRIYYYNNYYTTYASYATNAQGLVGPWLATPGSYSITAIMPNSDSTVLATSTIQAQAGGENALTLSCPVVGSASVNVLGTDGQLYKNHVSATLTSGSMNRSVATSSGTLAWPNLLPGAWTLVVRDPRTGGNLASVVLNVSADTNATSSVRLPNLGQIQVQVLMPDGSAAARNLQIRCMGSDGANTYQNTDDSGRVVFSTVAPGVARISANHPVNQLPASLDVTLSDGGLAQATLSLPGSGKVVLNLLTADGRAAQNRPVRVMDGTLNVREVYLSAGTATLDRIPLGRDLVLVDAYSYSGPWTPRFPDQAFRLEQDGETKPYNLSLLLGSLQVTVAGDAGAPIQDVYLVAGGRLTASTLADGKATILDVPQDVPFTVNASCAGYLTRDVPNVMVPSGQPVGSLAVSMLKTHTVDFSVRRANGNTVYGSWKFTRSGSTVTQTNNQPYIRWQVPENGEFTLEGFILVGTHQAGSVSNYSYYGNNWPWTGKTTVTLTPDSPDQVVTATLPALSSFTLHLQTPDGLPLSCNRNLSLILKNSTVPSFLPNLAAVNFNPKTLGANLVMGEHFPEGTHTFALKDRTGLEIGTFDLVVRPEDDGLRLERTIKVTLPSMASLSLHLKDALGRELLENHNFQLRMKQSSVTGFAMNFSVWGNDPVYSQDFPEGTHTFAVVDSYFGELATFDLTVSATDDGKILERTLNLPYVRSDWTIQAFAGDGVTPAIGSNLGVYCPSNGYSMNLSQGTTRSIETPNGTTLRAYAEYQPFGKYESVRTEGGDRSSTEGLSVSETLTMDLTVLRFRLLETDGQSGVFNQAMDLPGITEGDSERIPFAAWTDDQGETRMLVLGQDAGSQLQTRVFDLDSGLGKSQEVTVPEIGERLDQDITLPDHGWLETPAFQRNDGGPSNYFIVGVGSSAPGLVRPELAKWHCDPEAGQWHASNVSVTLNEGGVDVNGDFDAGTVIMNQVRIPASGELWMAVPVLNTSEGRWLESGGPWGHQPYTVASGSILNLIVPESTDTWADVPFQALDGDDQPLNYLSLRFRLDQGPGDWDFGSLWLDWSDVPDRQYRLPLGIPVLMESEEGDCTYWYGQLRFTPTLPLTPPGPVFKTTEQRFGPCE